MKRARTEECTLRYAAANSANLKLMELPADLAESLQVGDTVHICAPADTGAAHLVTTDKTYLIRSGETSNTLLLVAPNEESASSMDVVGSLHSQYELTEISPREGVEGLRALLYTHPYTSAEFRGQVTVPEEVRQWTTESLLERLPISWSQLSEALHDLHAFQLDGVWRVLDTTYANETAALFIAACAEHEWPLDEIDEGAVRAELDTQAPCAIGQVLNRFGKCDGSKWVLDRRALGEFGVEQLFAKHPEGYLWESEDFLQRWRLCMPDCSEPDPEILSYMVLEHQMGDETYYQFFPEKRLSLDPKTRISQLFDQRDRWTLAEIGPFLQRVEGPGAQQAALLLKYARYTEDPNTGAPAYCRR